jgi:hypothetical protein
MKYITREAIESKNTRTTYKNKFNIKLQQFFDLNIKLQQFFDLNIKLQQFFDLNIKLRELFLSQNIFCKLLIKSMLNC